MKVEFSEAVTWNEDFRPEQFRLSLAVLRESETSYVDPGYFFDPETAVACDLSYCSDFFDQYDASPYDGPNGDYRPGFCSLCTKTGPNEDDHLLIDSVRERSVEVLELAFLGKMTMGACAQAEGPTVNFHLHYRTDGGGGVVDTCGNRLASFGESWVTADWALDVPGAFPELEPPRPIPECY